jgi:hypothetical protein
MRNLVIGMLAALTLGACATRHEIYSRDGSTEEDFQRELAGCRNKLAMVPAIPTNENAGGLESLGNSLANMGNREQFMQDCLRSQGWNRQR